MESDLLLLPSLSALRESTALPEQAIQLLQQQQHQQQQQKKRRLSTENSFVDINNKNNKNKSNSKNSKNNNNSNKVFSITDHLDYFEAFIDNNNNLFLSSLCPLPTGYYYYYY